jgi:hypothetical protein
VSCGLLDVVCALLQRLEFRAQEEGDLAIGSKASILRLGQGARQRMENTILCVCTHHPLRMHICLVPGCFRVWYVTFDINPLHAGGFFQLLDAEGGAVRGGMPQGSNELAPAVVYLQVGACERVGLVCTEYACAVQRERERERERERLIFLSLCLCPSLCLCLSPSPGQLVPWSVL